MSIATPSQVAEARERAAHARAAPSKMVNGTLFCELQQEDLRILLQALDERTKALEQARAAISWACGEGESDFAEKETEVFAVVHRYVPRYWWRKELHERAEDTNRG